MAEQAEGFTWRLRRQQEIVLSGAVITIAPWVKNPPTVAQLMGEPVSETEFERLAGLDDPMSALDAALEKQRRMKASP